MTTPEQDPSKPARGLTPPLRVPIYGIFAILLVHTLAWAAAFLIPVCAAILGFFVVSRPRRWLERRGVPSFVTAGVMSVAITLLVGVSLVRLSQPTADFLRDIPYLAQQVSAKMARSEGPLKAIDKASEAADEIMKGDDKSEPGKQKPVEVTVVSDTSVASKVALMAPGVLTQIGFTMVLLFFLIASGDAFIAKTVQSLGRFSDKRKAVEVFYTIEKRLGRYLGGIAVINAGLGVAIGVALWWLGMPVPGAFGVMAFALNFVPFLGAIIGAGLAGAVAFVTFPGIWPAVSVVATYMILTSIEGQIVTPLLISRRMRLNTTVVLVTVAFFAWIWSVMGMVVALPVLIVLKIVSDQFEGLHTLGRFLGDGSLDPDDDPAGADARER